MGEQRRVSLVRTMLFQSDLMLLDEPFASLDKTTKVFMHNIICDYKLKLKILDSENYFQEIVIKYYYREIFQEI